MLCVSTSSSHLRIRALAPTRPRPHTRSNRPGIESTLGSLFPLSDHLLFRKHARKGGRRRQPARPTGPALVPRVVAAAADWLIPTLGRWPVANRSGVGQGNSYCLRLGPLRSLSSRGRTARRRRQGDWSGLDILICNPLPLLQLKGSRCPRGVANWAFLKI